MVGALVYVICSREVGRITANVDEVRVLVDTDVIDLHRGREGQVVQVDMTEVG